MAFNRYFGFLELNIRWDSNIVYAITSLNVLTFQTVDDRTAHDSNLVLCLLNQRIRLHETGLHREFEFDDVALLPLARLAQVFSQDGLAVQSQLHAGRPSGNVHADAFQRLGFLDSQRDVSVPGIVGRLFYLEILGLERILAVEVHPQRIALDGVGVLLSFAECA